MTLKRRLLSSSAAGVAIRRKAIEISGAPASIGAIPDDFSDDIEQSDAAVAIRQIGCTRRVFLMKPYMNQQELEGLTYRIRALSKNDAINSILIATDDTDDAETGAMPSSLLERDYSYLYNESVDDGLPVKPGFAWHVSGGYDPLEVYESGDYKNPEELDLLLNNVRELALAIRGDRRKTKIPTIFIPHGIMNDAGYVFGHSSYVMATRESGFRINNPSKGLSLDPIGLSYLLPRLGKEFEQPSAKYIGCGMILGLMGYEADAQDMMETGLATNYMESPTTLGSLERTLAELPPYNQQGLLKKPVRFYGQPEPLMDHNAKFRNVAVADAVHCFSTYRADGSDMWGYSEEDAFIGEDPSLETDFVPWHAERYSDLVDYAATFDDIFANETTVVGMLERFREIASRQTENEEEKEGILVAADFCRRLESQSPLAVSVVHRLLRIGAGKGETLTSCMEREHKALFTLYGRDDFLHWAKYASKAQDEETASVRFSSWKHESVAHVSPVEVDEILEL